MGLKMSSRKPSSLPRSPTKPKRKSKPSTSGGDVSKTRKERVVPPAPSLIASHRHLKFNPGYQVYLKKRRKVIKTSSSDLTYHQANKQMADEWMNMNASEQLE